MSEVILFYGLITLFAFVLGYIGVKAIRAREFSYFVRGFDIRQVYRIGRSAIIFGITFVIVALFWSIWGLIGIGKSLTLPEHLSGSFYAISRDIFILGCVTLPVMVIGAGIGEIVHFRSKDKTKL